jgi:hypothetical protein
MSSPSTSSQADRLPARHRARGLPRQPHGCGQLPGPAVGGGPQSDHGAAVVLASILRRLPSHAPRMRQPPLVEEAMGGHPRLCFGNCRRRLSYTHAPVTKLLV